MKHEIGNRTYIVADVDPLDVDGVRTVEVGGGAVAARLPRAAAVLRPARGQRPGLVAVDLPGRVRAGAVRPGVLPRAGARAAPAPAAAGHELPGPASRSARRRSSRSACRARGRAAARGSASWTASPRSAHRSRGRSDTTLPSSLALPLAHTPNISDSGPASRSRKPQLVQRVRGCWASGDGGAGVAVVPPLGGECRGPRATGSGPGPGRGRRPPGGPGPCSSASSGSSPKEYVGTSRGSSSSTGSRSPGDRSPGWSRSL